MCASSRLDQASVGLTGRGWNQFPPKTRLHHIRNVYKYRRLVCAASGTEFGGERLLHCHPHQQRCPSGGCGGSLCPAVTEHLTNWDAAVTTRLGVLWLLKLQFWRKLGKSQWTNKKFNEQKCQSLRNISDASPLTLLSCANTVGKPFSWPCVVIPCTPLLFGMPPAALFRGCSLDGISYLGAGPYFSWDSAGKLIFKKTSSSGEQHFLLLNNRLVGKVPWNLDNKRRKWSPLLSKHISLSNSKKCIAKPLCLSLHTPRTDGTAELDLCQGSSEEWLERLLLFLPVESLTLSKSVLFS